MNRLLATAVLSSLVVTLSIAMPPKAAATEESDIYLTAESFVWQEFEDSGAQFLKESGFLYGLGGSIKRDALKLLTLKGKGELFFGKINYDGQTQSGTPVKTDTDYFGLKMEGDIGGEFMVTEKSSLGPFAGLGYRWWVRDIQSMGNSIGYEETWQSYYARLGIRGNRALSDQSQLFAEACMKLPIQNENEVDLDALGLDLTLKPGRKTSAFAEIGLKSGTFKITAFYEGLRFSKSDTVNIGTGQAWQPESKADIFGINLGTIF